MSIAELKKQIKKEKNEDHHSIGFKLGLDYAKALINEFEAEIRKRLEEADCANCFFLDECAIKCFELDKSQAELCPLRWVLGSSCSPASQQPKKREEDK